MSFYYITCSGIPHPLPPDVNVGFYDCGITGHDREQNYSHHNIEFGGRGLDDLKLAQFSASVSAFFAKGVFSQASFILLS